jgi:large subunit ribosomal protein L22
MASVAEQNGLVVRAQARWVRLSARKARVVLEHIRGRSVPEARTVLAFTQRAAAVEIEKVLRSAVANAEANHGVLDANELVILHAFADEGPTLKRWKPRARGRVNRIRKRTCHITIELVQLEEAPARRAKRAQAPATTETTEPTTEAKPKASRRKKTEEAVA